MKINKLPDIVFDIFEYGLIYVLISGKIHRTKIVSIDWFHNKMLVRHKNGWMYIINPYEYKKTWSSSRFDLVKLLKKGKLRNGQRNKRR